MSRSREHIDLRVKNGIAMVLLDRPPVNALNAQLQEELRDAFDELLTRNDAGVIILTSTSKKAFMAGADISIFTEMGPDEALKMSESTQNVFNFIHSANKVVIAAVSGLALGGGCELALACDIRVADSTAVFGFPEVSLGLFPGAGGTQRLSRLVGTGKAKELILTGDPIGATEAKEIGLIERLAVEGEAATEAENLGRRILLRGPIAVANAKKAIDGGINMRLQDGLQIERRLFSDLFRTNDCKEGIQAFMEKRKPHFIGE